MAFKRTTLFPDYIYEGQIEIPDTLRGGIKESIELNKQSGITTELVYGWNTNKQFPMEGVMPNLVNLMATYFVDSVLGSNDLKNRDINLLNPYLISIFPTHQYPTTIEPQRWYNAGMFIQTTNKGSHLSFQNYGNKLYAGQNTQENTTYVKPKQFKVVFWPSHIPWSLTPNMSMVETTMLVCTFRADARKK